MATPFFALRRNRLPVWRAFSVLTLLCIAPVCAATEETKATQPTRQRVLQTMRTATQFMVEKVSCEGGYVWSYLPDLSRRWGELEARTTQVWVQPPGTASMGHLFLDAYHATGDEYYYAAAEKVASALSRGQHASGGWNYLIDFAGGDSLQEWYATIGKNAWRLEEFQHYQANATFDDGGTAESTRFFLRMYLEKRDERHLPPLRRALDFILEAQYPNGGWPQRFPPLRDQPGHYSSYITFNDDVAAENIEVLLLSYQAFGEARMKDAILRGMDAFVATQGKPPQAGWALQYTLDLKPAGARSYEPRAYATHATAGNIEQLFRFYEITADKKYIAGIPAALDWLDAVALAPKLRHHARGRTHPTFVEVGTNRPIFLHRTGSNVSNGRYFTDYEPSHTIFHYSSFRIIDTAVLRRRLQRVEKQSTRVLRENSPLRYPPKEGWLPRYFMTKPDAGSDVNTRMHAESDSSASRLEELLGGLNAEGYWPVELRFTSHPYVGPGSSSAASAEYSDRTVGDETDTSPYLADNPVKGISTGAYIRNMAELIRALRDR